MCGFEAAAEGGFVHVVREDPLAVDRDLLELELELVVERPDLGQRTLAEVALRCVIDGDSMDRGHESPWLPRPVRPRARTRRCA